jgi:hypothetical protein
MAFCLFVVGGVAPQARAADPWTVPTPEELSMTSQPQVPGASAVYLYREEKTDDPDQTYSEYVRLKILTEGGKDFANVELRYVSEGSTDYSIGEIAGRTIHPDGTVIPFTGKPYERVVEKVKGYKEKAKVFTLPDVTVGSIIEYRYKVHWNYALFSYPVWLVQNEIYLRKGYFFWRPLDRAHYSVGEHGLQTDYIAWTPILPTGFDVVVPNQAKGARRFFNLTGTTMELNVHDIDPALVEEYMPPLRDLSYRVMFYYTSYKNADEFWKGEGLQWSKEEDKFIGPGPVVKAAVQQLVVSSDTPEQKLRKIYAAVEQVENTSFTRERTGKEDKAQGIKEAHSTDDVWNYKRGSSYQVTQLFVAMVRAAGMKANVMAITDRLTGIFLSNYLSLRQLNFDIAIVTIDGKELAFDPSSRFCPFGQLAWQHSNAYGLRQIEGGAIEAKTPNQSFRDSRFIRVANLKMDETGEAAGKIDLKLTGAPALFWRQRALIEDREAMERELRDELAETLPAGVDLKLLSVGGLAEYEQPMTASFEMKGKIASVTGRRLLIPANLFVANAKPMFSKEKRELAVWLWYPYTETDGLRIDTPAGFTVESLPAAAQISLPKMAAYGMTAKSDAKGITIRRDLEIGQTLYLPKEYPDLHNFYSQFQSKDQEPIILKAVPAASPGN